MRAIIFIALLSIDAHALAAPFNTRDQNPLLAGFGLAEPLSARVTANNGVSAQLNWSSTALIQRSSNEALTVDVESQEWQLSFDHPFNDSFAIHVQIPYRTTGGGSLDHFIENWHSLFGLPNGDRGSLPKNDFLIDYRRNGVQTLRYSGSSLGGIGDISFASGYQLHASRDSAAALWWTVKFPTGNSSQLTSSGEFDTTLSLAHEYRLSDRWLSNAQASVSYLRTGPLLSDQQRHWVWQGMLGIDYSYSSALTLTLQLDAHTAVFSDSSLNLLGNVWILTMGGNYKLPSRWQLQFGVSEDVKVDASPDVNFVFAIGKSF